MNLLLVAHGTRKPGGVSMIGELAERVGDTLQRRVRVAFVDVLGPTPAEVLSTLPGPVVLVPAFLSSGYHVRHDIPANIAASGHSDVTVTRRAGPVPGDGPGADLPLAGNRLVPWRFRGAGRSRHL